MEKWTKNTYVCSSCDALIEYTTNTSKVSYVYLINLKCVCGGHATKLSEVDATITPTNERNQMETVTQNEYNPHTLITLKRLINSESGDVQYEMYKTTELETVLHDVRNKNNYLQTQLTEKQNSWYKKEAQLRTLLEEVYADSSEQETLAQIAEIFDIPLTKEIEYTAWVRVDMTIEVDLTSDTDAIEDFISSNLTVDSYDSAIQVTNHEIDRVEEGAY